ncbi:crocetin glucosyltransferase protein [Tanacetum coccineum]
MTTVMSKKQPHFFIVTYPAQGHINPSIQFAKRLIPLGVSNSPSPPRSCLPSHEQIGGLHGISNFALFSDGFCLKDTIHSNAENGTPVTCLVYTLLLPWAGEVARGLNVPSALLWIQPASVFRIYYYYFSGYGELIGDDFYILDLFKEEIERLNAVDNSIVLVNTVDALEEEALKDIEGKLKLIAVGPLLPSAFLDGINSADKSSGGDLFESSKDYLEWMNTKHEGSIVYNIFCEVFSIFEETKARQWTGLLESGLIVPWCSQLEVLSHPSLGCFVTHCGWNSTLESIVCGVPVVAFPQWTDQTTNAKLLVDVWETGVRVTANEDGVVEGEEIKRCLEMVMGGHDNGATMRKKAKEWKNFAREAMKESGSSCINLKSFVEGVARSSTQDSVSSSKEVKNSN